MSPESLPAALFDAVPDALVVVDADGCIVRANGNAERLFGYPCAALAGRYVEELLPPSVRSRHCKHRAGYTAAPHVRPMGAAGEPLAGLRCDGTVFPVEIALSPLADDHATLYLASIRDISDSPRERQAAVRQRYDAAVARLGQLALEAPGEAALIEAMPPLLAEALGGESVAIVLVAHDSPTAKVRAAAGMHWRVGDEASPSLGAHAAFPAPIVLEEEAAGVVAQAEFPLPLAGARCAVLIPLGHHGRVTGALAAAGSRRPRFDHDALHLLQSAANLMSAFLQQRRADEQLAHSQRLDALGQLTAGIAHDFNNLLTVLSGSLQLLEAESVSSEARDLVASALRSVSRGAELTGSLLAFARRQRLLPQAVDVNSLLLDLAAMLGRTLGRGIRLEVGCSERLAPAYADPGQLEAALLNLVLNARDAMLARGTIAIEAKECLIGTWQARETLPPGDYICVTVIDQGRGMAPETLARAIEPFFTTKEAGRGSGLGLSRIYGFARQSRGGLHIESCLGRGTRASLYVPVARHTVPTDTAAALSPSGRCGTILVVEDSPSLLAIASTFLRGSGYGVRTATTAEEALQRLDAEPGIALLFSDVMLGPGLRGDELARVARERTPTLAVLLTSGYGECVAPGPCDLEVLQKPYRREQLIAAIASLLEPATDAAGASGGI